MDVVLTVAGISVIGLGLWDMFQSLLHPGGRGSVSRLVFAGVWGASRMTGHRLGPVVGPGAMAAVVVLWVLLQGVGWALVYVPHVPEGFRYSSGVDPADYQIFAEALYVSFVTLSTLGHGDVVPIEPWVRGVFPFESLTGFALLSAALTWFTHVYPPLSRRRALALGLKDLGDAGYAESIPRLDPAVATRVLDNLTGQVEQVSVDFVQYAETYYFQEEDAEHSLARQLPVALKLRDAAGASPTLAVRISAERLVGALEELGATLARDFVSGENLGEILTAYAADHGRLPRT